MTAALPPLGRGAQARRGGLEGPGGKGAGATGDCGGVGGRSRGLARGPLRLR